MSGRLALQTAGNPALKHSIRTIHATHGQNSKPECAQCGAWAPRYVQVQLQQAILIFIVGIATPTPHPHTNTLPLCCSPLSNELAVHKQRLAHHRIAMRWYSGWPLHANSRLVERGHLLLQKRCFVVQPGKSVDVPSVVPVGVTVV
jgi:hypothetical protein